MKEVITIITQIIIVIGIVGMWVTLGKEMWLFFMLISVISIIVYIVNGW